MEKIHDILKEYGLEIPADKKADFDKAWKENYCTKSEYDNVVSQRDNYKASHLQVKKLMTVMREQVLPTVASIRLLKNGLKVIT